MKNFKGLFLILGLMAFFLPHLSAQHFEAVWQGNPYNPTQFYITGAELDGVDLEAGDEIAIFDVNDCGAELCVGTAQLTGPISATNFLEIQASQNDAEAGEPQNGYIEGNDIIYRFWDSSEEIEIALIDATYYLDPPNWVDTFTAGSSVSPTLEGTSTAFAIAESVGGCNSTEIIVPVKIFSFNAITSIDMEIDYDNSKLTGFDFENVNPAFTGLIATTNDGVISIDWTGSSVSVNNEYLVDLVFTLDGTGSTCLNWNSGNSSINGGALDLMLADGNVFISQSPEISDVNVSDVTCYGQSNGSISITASGSSSQLLYSVDGGVSYQSAYVFNDLSADSYNLVVKDDLGCEAVYADNPIVITEPDDITISLVDVTQPLCYGDDSGQINIEAGGGTGSLQYSIDNGLTWQNTPDFIDLIPGDYIVAVKDENGCIQEYGINPVVIEQPNQIVIDEVNTTDVAGCFGDMSGVIQINATGGTGELEYSINGGFSWSTTETFSELDAGFYNVIVKDVNGCTRAYENNPVEINQPSELLITDVEVNDASAYNTQDGTIIITATGGTNPLYYSIDNGLSWETTETFNDLLAGEYNIWVKDENDCTKEYENNPVTINQPNELTIDNVQLTHVTGCYGNNNGEIEITASQGEPPYQYSIDNGANWQSSATFINLLADSYEVIVKDNNNFQEEYENNPVEINQPAEVEITTVDVLNVEGCYGDDTGEIHIDATGGTGSLLYSIDNGVTWGEESDFVGYPAGDYTIVVKDQNDCMISFVDNPVVITEPEELTITNISAINIQDCYGSSSGEITITSEGGTAPVYYSIDNGNTWQLDNSFLNLQAGDYSVMIKDQNECAKEFTNNPVTLTQPVELEIITLTTVDVVGCFGNMNGEIHLTATGGTGSIQYSIDEGSTWQASGDFTDIAGGSYQVLIKDDNDCIISYEDNPVVIAQPNEIIINSVDAQDASEFEADDGSIIVYAEGGTGELQYSIDDGVSWQSENLFEPLNPGEYNVSVKDANECITEYESNPVVINEPPQLAIDEVQYENVTGCYGNSNGSITIFATGGSSTILYSIDDGGNWYDNDGLFENLDVGEFYIKVKNEDDVIVEYDANPVIITQPEQLVIDEVISTDLTCYGGATGEISIMASGGTGDFQYSIDDGTTWQELPNFVSLEAGEYIIQAKDANDCITSYEDNPVILTQPEQIIVDAEVMTIDCYNSDNGAINVVATGGTGVLQYSIDNGNNWEGDPSFTDLGPGNYNVVVMDENNCQLPYSENPIELTEPEQITVDASVTDVSCYGAENGFIEIMASGGTGEFLYTIGNGWQSGNEFTGLEPGVYTVMVQDANGCMVPYPENPVFITQPELLEIPEISSESPTCYDGMDGMIEITSSGGTGEHQYSVDGGINWQSEALFESLGAGSYEVSVKDANGCVTTYSDNPVVLIDPAAIVIEGVIIEDITCYGLNNALIQINATGGTGSLQYSISDGDSWQPASLFEDLGPGEYFVLVKDENDCQIEWEDNPIIIEEPAQLIINDVSYQDITCNGGSDGMISIEPNGGTEPIMYSIDNGASFQLESEFTELEAGEYYISVKDQNDCETNYADNPVMLSEPEPLTVTITAEPDTIVCGDDIITLTAEASEESSYTWQPTGQIGASIEVDSAGIGYGIQQFTVSAESEEGCFAEDQITLIFTDCTDIESIDSEIKVLIKPNPSKGKFELEVLGAISDFTLGIYDATGTLVVKNTNQKINSNKYSKSFDLSSQSNGIYYLRIRTKNDVIVKKFILSK